MQLGRVARREMEVRSWKKGDERTAKEEKKREGMEKT